MAHRTPRCPLSQYTDIPQCDLGYDFARANYYPDTVDDFGEWLRDSEVLNPDDELVAYWDPKINKWICLLSSELHDYLRDERVPHSKPLTLGVGVGRCTFEDDDRRLVGLHPLGAPQGIFERFNRWFTPNYPADEEEILRGGLSELVSNY